MSTEKRAPREAGRPMGFWTAIIDWFITEVPRWLRYAYFLRFSILLWSFPLILWSANWRNHARSLVSGVITPETWGQYLCVFFFLTSASLVALMLARIVIINGEERFGENPPKLLSRWLADVGGHCEWAALLVAQANTAILTAYFVMNGAAEGVAWQQVGIGFIAGVTASFLFWYTVTAIYYITYRPEIGSTVAAAMSLGGPTARTLILPRSLLFLSRTGKPCFGDALEDADTPIPTEWLARVFPVSGYRWPPNGALFEGHYFSVLAAVGFFALYWFLWPLTAPIPAVAASRWALGLELIGGIAVYALVLSARIAGPADPPELQKARKSLSAWKAILAVPIMVFSVGVPILCVQLDVSRFPILALVLILVISLSWMFSAIAFYADRFRIPVLTVFLVVLIVPRLFQWTGQKEEHYLSIAVKSEQTTLPTPSQIMDARIRRARMTAGQEKQTSDSIPTFIVVTSTGGGIHAAGWTTAVLKHLEDQFGGHFHDHVLLLSTVSGGSAGLLTYMRELHDAANGGSPDWSRLVPEAECSSLEAIGWGLVYYDVPKAVVPFFPYLFSPSSGVDDLKAGPLGMDRTWSLRRAFERNLNNPHCRPAANPGLAVPKSEVAAGQTRDDAAYDQLTLGSFSAMQNTAPYPAFSMNTTTVENGSRFLLANYRVARDANAGTPPPAESFLDVYGNQQPGGSGYADLPLQTAAQLSATFPYVSSAATFPALPGKKTVHFVDGGYYDNDGTASALEFLRAALDGSTELNPKSSENAKKGISAGKRLDQPNALPAPSKVRILLVEIRNSKEANAGKLPLALKDDPDKKCTPWSLGDQLTAPLKAFYGGGHDSVTGRNRAILALLEGSYRDKLILRHFLITDDTNGSDNVSCLPDKNPATDPLNWSLTPKQRNEVGASADLYNARYDHIRRCFSDDAVCPKGDEEVPY